MAARPEFKRALLGLHLDAPDQKAIDVACEMARLLRLELVGVFAADEALRELAGYPSAREFVPAGRIWRSIDRERMIEEERRLAEAAQRELSRIASATGVPASFEIVSGPATRAFTSMSCTSDILVIAEPTQASAMVTRSFSLVFNAALRSPASVLLVPRLVKRRRGPIVVVAHAPDDPSIAVASAIAAAAREEHILIDAAQRIEPLFRMGKISPRLEDHNESLIVVTRGDVVGGDDFGLALADQRRVPVLILEPPTR